MPYHPNGRHPYHIVPHRTVIIVIVYINDEEYISIGNDNSIFVHVYQLEFVSCSCNKHSLILLHSLHTSATLKFEDFIVDV